MQVFSTKITHYYVLIAAELLGLGSYIPPFATARGKEILKGVNYASGSAGIRNETGRQVVIYYLMQGHYSIFSSLHDHRTLLDALNFTLI